MEATQDSMVQIKPRPVPHKASAFERGTSGDQGQHKGYAASCETCEAVTFGGFRTKTQAKCALMHTAVGTRG